MKTIGILEPLFASYRLPVYRRLAQRYNVRLVCSPIAREAGFQPAAELDCTQFTVQEVPARTFLRRPRLVWQPGACRALAASRPHAVLVSANPRNLSSWAVLAWGQWHRIPVLL